MYGPQPRGYWTSAKAQNCGDTHQHLIAGEQYRVVREFTDYNGHLHPVGETWGFAGFSCLPYDDGLSLFVSFDGEHEWHIPMQWRPEAQGSVIDNLTDYVQKT